MGLITFDGLYRNEQVIFLTYLWDVQGEPVREREFIILKIGQLRKKKNIIVAIKNVLLIGLCSLKGPGLFLRKKN